MGRMLQPPFLKHIPPQTFWNDSVTLREVVVVYFLRKRFWLYRQKKNQKKVTLTAAESSPGLHSSAVLESFLGCFCNDIELCILMYGRWVSPCVASEVKHK